MPGQKCDWPCWEIMNCNESKECPARANPEIPCWEIARAASDYRHVLQVCPDCIVYILKGENKRLNNNEVQTIMLQKANCVLTSEEYCVNY